MFVTFEGGEGSGKTTCIRTVERDLMAHGVSVSRFAEPGSTPIGHKLREILLYRSSSEQSQITPMAELLMFCASRAQFTETVLRPLLNIQGQASIVLCDRYADSTLAYQLYGRGLPWHDVHAAVSMSMNHIQPDLTFFFDIPPSEALKRLTPDRLNRLDAEDIRFHERVYDGYQNLIAQETTPRWKRLDATQPPEIVAQQAAEIIWTAYQERIAS